MKLINHDWQGPLCESWCCVCLASRRLRQGGEDLSRGGLGNARYLSGRRESAERFAWRTGTTHLSWTEMQLQLQLEEIWPVRTDWFEAFSAISIVYTFRTDDDRFENIPSVTDERPMLDTCLEGSSSSLTPFILQPPGLVSTFCRHRKANNVHHCSCLLPPPTTGALWWARRLTKRAACRGLSSNRPARRTRT